MDDFIDPFLQPSSWEDMSPSVKSYRGDEKSPSICRIPSGIDNLAVEDVDLFGHDDNSSFFTVADLKFGIRNGLFSGENLSQHDLQNHTSHLSQHDNNAHESSFSLEGNSTAGIFGSELNTPCSVTLPHNSISVSSSIESSGSEQCGFPSSLGDAHSISSVSAIWPSSYSDVSFMGQGKMHNFGFQEVGNDAEILKKSSLLNGRYSTMDSFPREYLQDQNDFGNSHMANFSTGQHMKLTSSFQPHQQEQNDMNNLHMPYLASGSQMISNKFAGIQARQQLSQPTQVNSTKHQTNNSSGHQSHLPQANGSASNGAAKPRVRARRGQATDPHSIAERLRREKISERMKNLQELVPNSNKIDKASMLDEIIDYVRFLQLQVKVLSMSRLGAAGAVVPLITDGQAERPSSLFLPPSSGKRVADLSESDDNLAFEQEVVKLMESNVTTAMQYLQNKGLCLMPLALAAAISNKKGSSSAILQDRRNGEANHNAISRCLIEGNDIEDGSSGCNGDIKNNGN